MLVPDVFCLSHVAMGSQMPDDWYAGEIKQIFTVASGPSPGKAYFVLQRFKEFSAQEAHRDPYWQYPLVGGHLYHPELEDEICVVMMQKIVAHFACTPFSKQEFGFPCFHVLPLDKVPRTHIQDEQRQWLPLGLNLYNMPTRSLSGAPMSHILHITALYK